MGHFLALQQLAGAHKQIGGAIFMPDQSHQDHFGEHFSALPLTPVYSKDNLFQRLTLLKSSGQALVCLAGNSQLVADLRRSLRKAGFAGRIHAQGFW